MTDVVAEVREPAVARGPATQRAAKRPLRLREVLFWLAMPVLVLLAGRAVVAEPFKIPSTSMTPTLEVGDHVLVNKLAYTFGSPHVGDLAVLHSPEDGELLIKRIVAFEGQRVEIRDGVLFVDRVPKRESYVDYEMVDGFFFGPYRVAEDSAFVLGDARGDSRDSREFGSVPLDDLVGRADLRVAPVGRFGTL